MPSPFPGMDPWLEGEEVFPNLHDRFIISVQDALNAALPPGYVATSKNRVWVDDELRREPDVAACSGRDPPAERQRWSVRRRTSGTDRDRAGNHLRPARGAVP